MIATLLKKPVSTKSAYEHARVSDTDSRDEELKTRVVSYLDQQQTGLARRVQVKVIAGIVILEGIVTSYHQKQVAQECWKRVAGILGVRNNLEVHAKA